MTAPVQKTTSRKAVGYVVQNDRLLVFTHLDVPLDVTGIQVPAGTVRADEEPAAAAVREVREETGLKASVIRRLGTDTYDYSPLRFEVATRYFFLLAPDHPSEVQERWDASEENPEHGGGIRRWECWWMPLGQAHVLAGGLGSRIGALYGTSRSFI